MSTPPPNSGVAGQDDVVEQVQRMVERSRSMWSKAREAIEEARIMRADVQRQVEEFAKQDGFRHKYVDSMLPRILDRAIANTGADMGNIQILDPLTGQLRIRAQLGFERPFLEFFDSVHKGQGSCGTTLRTVCRVTVPDVLNSPIFVGTPNLEVMLDARVRSVQSTPLLGRSGQIVGVFTTHYRGLREPGQRDVRLIDYFAAFAAALIDWRNGGPLSPQTLCPTLEP